MSKNTGPKTWTRTFEAFCPQKEEWRWIRGYENLYQVSNLGRVKSWKRKKEILLIPYKNKKGYQQVCLFKKGMKRKSPFVHILVFETFYRRLLPNEQCHHLNKIPDCNISTNLVAKDKFFHKSQHCLGRTAWNRGLTKYNDERVKRISNANKNNPHKKDSRTGKFIANN